MERILLHRTRDRTELLVLLTQQVVRDQTDARADRGPANGVAQMPALARLERASGAIEPSRQIRERVSRLIIR
jgi:hypothetical protein